MLNGLIYSGAGPKSCLGILRERIVSPSAAFWLKLKEMIGNVNGFLLTGRSIFNLNVVWMTMDEIITSSRLCSVTPLMECKKYPV